MAQTKSGTSTKRKSGSSRSRVSGSSRAKTNGRANGASRTKKTNGRANDTSPTKKTSRTKSSSASSRAKTQASRRSRPQASSNGVGDSVKGTADSVMDAVTSGAQGAGKEITTVARKAKVPLLASGTALAGVAAAVVVARSGKRRKVLGVSMPKRNGFKKDARKVAEAVTDAAKRADHFGQGMSRVANSVQKVSETADEAVKKT
jgi:hypothetical protein